MIRVSSLAPIVEELDRRGLRADALMTRHMMTRSQLADLYQEIPLARYVSFLDDAARVEGDEFLCAKIGGQFRAAHLGPVGLLFGASSTLRRGLERLARWLNAWQDSTATSISEEEGTLVWSYRLNSDFWPRRQDADYTLAATVAFAREAFGTAVRPLEVHIEHAEPADVAPLVRIFGLRPQFSQPCNRLVFDRVESERVHRAEDRTLMAVLERHVGDLCQPTEGPGGLIGRVRTILLIRLGYHRSITLPVIAAELNMSTRAMQRQLADEGSSFRAVVRGFRLELGRLQLQEGRASNAEIANSLGYSDNTAFWRAFKAETGSTPSRFRRAL